MIACSDAGSVLLLLALVLLVGAFLIALRTIRLQREALDRLRWHRFH